MARGFMTETLVCPKVEMDATAWLCRSDEAVHTVECVLEVATVTLEVQHTRPDFMKTWERPGSEEQKEQVLGRTNTPTLVKHNEGKPWWLCLWGPCCFYPCANWAWGLFGPVLDATNDTIQDIWQHQIAKYNSSFDKQPNSTVKEQIDNCCIRAFLFPFFMIVMIMYIGMRYPFIFLGNFIRDPPAWCGCGCLCLIELLTFQWIGHCHLFCYETDYVQCAVCCGWCFCCR